MSFHVWGSDGETGNNSILGESKIKGSEDIGLVRMQESWGEART